MECLERMSATPAQEATDEQKRAAVTSGWETTRRAAIMAANAWLDAGQVCNSRDMKFTGALLMAVASAIKARLAF